MLRARAVGRQALRGHLRVGVHGVRPHGWKTVNNFRSGLAVSAVAFAVSMLVLPLAYPFYPK